jgi:hypothetical protein
MVTSASSVGSDKQDLLRAMDFALDCFDRWRKENLITAEQQQVLSQYYKENHHRVETGGPPTEEMTLRSRDQCWGCRGILPTRTEEFCLECGLPLQTADVERLRYLIFLCFEIKKHMNAGRLNLATGHELMAEGNNRIAALRRKLDRERLPMVQPVASRPQPTAAPVRDDPPPRTATTPPPRRPHATRSATVESRPAREPSPPRRSILEILLDPRTIQWMLASGGALLALGLIIWLATKGLFEDKLAVAVILGVGNAALLGGGWSLMLFTRHQLAGRALTLLACLVMPFNLWFYDAQGLISLRDGGPLWLPALVCCVLYAASARILKDAMFVPVFVLGVTLTSLLLLPQQLFLKFWEATWSSTLLVVFGIVFIHVERAFPVYDGPFSRKKFGLAFFWSGHAVLACGLLLLFFAQMFGGWLFMVFKPLYDQFGFTQPEVALPGFGRWLALALVLAGTYAYAYSDIVVRRIGVYIALAVFTLLWAEILLITIVAEHVNISPIEIIIVVLAVTGLLTNLFITARAKGTEALQRVGEPLALFLCGLPVLFGVVLQIRGTFPAEPIHYHLQWSYVAAMLITAVSCRIGAHLYRHEQKVISTIYFFGTAAATLAGAAGLLLVASEGKMPWHEQAPLLMIIPILYLIASRLYRGQAAERPLGWVAHAATAFMVLVSLWNGGLEMLLDEPHQRKQLYLMLTVFFAETTLFYAVAAVTREKAANVYFATIGAFLAMWQLFNYLAISHEWYTLAFAVVGLVLLCLYRFAVLEPFGGGLAHASFQCANAMLLLAFTAAALITGVELLRHMDEVSRGTYDPLSASKWLLVGMLLTMVLTSVLAVALMRHREWRRVYVAASVVNAALVVVVLVTLGGLEWYKKLEIVTLAIGVLLLAVGYAGWYREQDENNDLVGVSLLLGSLLVAATFTIAVVAGRWSRNFDTPEHVTFHLLNEIGMLVFGLLLLASGYACQLKAPTLWGTFMMVVYILSLVLYVQLPEKLNTAAVYIMIGGGVFFLTGLFLSIYRDRLLALPERFKRREGVFRVLSWR